VVTRRNKKLPFSFGPGNPSREAKDKQTVGQALSALFGQGGSPSKSKSDKKLPSQKTVGDLLSEIDFGSTSDGGIDPALLPKDFSAEPASSTTTTTQKPQGPKSGQIDVSSLFKEVSLNDLKNLLPPGYNPDEVKESVSTTTTTTTTAAPSELTKQLEILLKSLNTTGLSTELKSKLALAGLITQTEKTTLKPPIVFKDAIDASLLPPGFKPEPESPSNSKPLLPKPIDVSKFLPPGYNESFEASVSTSEKPGTGEDKASWLVFPGGARTRKPIPTSTAAPTVKPASITFGFPKR
jgi:hypothetical protein